MSRRTFVAYRLRNYLHFSLKQYATVAVLYHTSSQRDRLVRYHLVPSTLGTYRYLPIFYKAFYDGIITYYLPT